MFARWDYREYRRWCRRRRRRIFFLLAVAFVLVAAAAHAADGHSGHGNAAHDSKRGAPATHRRTRTARRAKAALPGIGTAGTGLIWTGFHGIELPGSAEDGPRHARNGVAWGFSDTPGGALVAAVNVGVRTAALWGPAIYVPTITHQVTGPDEAALLSADASDYAALRAANRVEPGHPAGRGYAVEAAFRFVAYTPAEATVDIVTEGPGAGGATALAATRVQVVWQRGDWRVVAPPGGNWANSATTVSSLTGYTTFANQG